MSPLVDEFRHFSYYILFFLTIRRSRINFYSVAKKRTSAFLNGIFILAKILGI
jgi:hypothetical protein